MPRKYALIFGASLLAVAVTGYEAGRHSTDGRAARPPQQGEPSVSVAAVPIRAGRVEQQWVLYGTVAALSSAVHTYVLPFEVRITRLDVSTGQRVGANDPLFETVRTPVTAVAAETAVDVLREATQTLEQVSDRRRVGLATREELTQAQGRVRRAQQQVASMERSGQVSERLTTAALMSGVVSGIGGQMGVVVSSGTPIVNVTDDESIGVELWADPVKSRSIEAGTIVSIEALGTDRPRSSDGWVVRVDQRVDDKTRLVRVSVNLDRPDLLLLGQAVRARVRIPSAEGFVVPRSSLVVSGGKSRIYVLDEGHAWARPITVIADSGDEVLVHGDGIAAGQRVVTRGAYQAEDGMRVEVDL